MGEKEKMKRIFLGLLLCVFSVGAFGEELPIGKWVAEESGLELYIKNRDSVYLKKKGAPDKDKLKMKLEIRGDKLFISNEKIKYEKREGVYSFYLQELNRGDEKQYSGHYTDTANRTLDNELEPRGYIIKNSTIAFNITSTYHEKTRRVTFRGTAGMFNTHKEVFNKYIGDEEVSSYLLKLNNDQILKTIAHENYVRFHNEKIKEARKAISAEMATRIFKEEQQKQAALIQRKERVKKENEENRIRAIEEEARTEVKRRKREEKNRKKDKKDLANEAIYRKNGISQKSLEFAKDKVFPFGVWHSTEEKHVTLYLNSLEDMYITYGDDCKGSLYLKTVSVYQKRIVNKFKLHTWKWDGCTRPVERLLGGAIDKKTPDVLEVARFHRYGRIFDKFVRYDDKGESLEDARVKNIPVKIKEDFIEGEITESNYMELNSLLEEMTAQMSDAFKLGNKEKASEKMKEINEINKKLAVKMYNQAIELEKENKNKKAYFNYTRSLIFSYYFFTKNRIEYNTRYSIPNALYNKALMLIEGRGVKRDVLDAWWDFKRILTPRGTSKVIGFASKELKANALYNIALLDCKFPIELRSQSLFSQGDNKSLQAKGRAECAAAAKKALDFGYDKNKIDSLMESYNLVLPI